MCSRKWSTMAERAWASVLVEVCRRGSRRRAQRRRRRRVADSSPTAPASTSTPTDRPRRSTTCRRAIAAAVCARLRRRGWTENTVRINQAGGGVLGPRPLPPMTGTSRRYICPLTKRTSMVSSGRTDQVEPLADAGRRRVLHQLDHQRGHGRVEVRRIALPRSRPRCLPRSVLHAAILSDDGEPALTA